MTEMQKQFEEWAKTRWVKPNLNRYLTGYENATINEQWQAWQASRAAIVVKLAELKVRGLVSQETIEGYKAAIDEFKCALDDAEVNYE